MLKTVDILLGLTVVMLTLSMMVTLLTQFVCGILNSRGRHMLHGLADLLQQIDPNIERKIAKQIAGTILSHPIICGTMGRYGTTIHREEFTKLLMDIAAGQTPSNSLGKNIIGCLQNILKNRKTHGPAEGLIKALLKIFELCKKDDIQKPLQKILEANDISSPKETLDKVRTLALQLELSNPELANDTRQAKALMQEANGRLVGKINSWFDQTVDRVADRFTVTTRTITVACAIAVVGVTQLDTVALINRLSMDDKLRNTLVEKAIEIEAKSAAAETQEKNAAPSGQPPSAPSQAAAKPNAGTPATPAPISALQADSPDKGKSKEMPAVKAAAPAPAPAGSSALPAAPPATADQSKNIQKQGEQLTGEAKKLPTSLTAFTEDEKKNIKQLVQLELITIPKNCDTWMKNWADINGFGVFLSVVLLSLGAPFWYNALKELIKLRSTLAGKDDEQRLERQRTQPAAQA